MLLQLKQQKGKAERSIKSNQLRICIKLENVNLWWTIRMLMNEFDWN